MTINWYLIFEIIVFINAALAFITVFRKAGLRQPGPADCDFCASSATACADGQLPGVKFIELEAGQNAVGQTGHAATNSGGLIICDDVTEGHLIGEPLCQNGYLSVVKIR